VKNAYVKSAIQERWKMKPIPSSLAKAYEQSRANLRSSLENASSDEINLNSQTLSADLMKSSDSEIITKLSKFVYSCFEQRLKYLETRNAD
jgi:hypothetical protein